MILRRESAGQFLHVFPLLRTHLTSTPKERRGKSHQIVDNNGKKGKGYHYRDESSRPESNFLSGNSRIVAVVRCTVLHSEFV